MQRGGTLLFLLLFVSLAVVTLVLDRANRLQPAKDLVAQVTAPIQGVLAAATRRVTDLREFFIDVEECRAKNEDLQLLVDQLIIENVRLREAEIENVNLRAQLNFKQANPSFKLLSAQVIGRDPSNLAGYLIIDRGREEGVAVGMPVLTDRGLVGRVTETAPHSSKILLITDPSSSVNALIQESRATGVVQGSVVQGLVMRYIQQTEEVKPGDLVLTSGLGGNFPTRLIVGQVTSVVKKDVELFQQAQIRPSVDFGRLEMVMVLTSFHPIDSEAEQQAP
ncbi:MAG TPA: rod shape-determining protein MreC [Anaerolineae bacterium]|nr:rod shape-determining protein MreC [Anaerolineae bacterium]